MLIPAAASAVPGAEFGRTCRECMHMARHGNCREPVAAGLAEWWCIRWAPPVHAALCLAFEPHPPMPPVGEDTLTEDHREVLRRRAIKRRIEERGQEGPR